MKLCYLANVNSIHTQRWLQYFVERGHEVHLVSFAPLANQFLENVTLHTPSVMRGIGKVRFTYEVRSLIRGANLFWISAQVRKMIGEINPQILHAHSVSDNGVIGRLTSFHPFVMTAWGSDILVAPQKSKLLKWGVKAALRKADFITCDAQHLAENMVELGADREKVAIIYFGTDIRRFAPDRRDPCFKSTLNVDARSPIVISLRNLTSLYDVESLVRAVPIVLEQVSDVKFVIAGRGEQRNYLEDLARELSVSASVIFTGLLPVDELPRYLASADVYVSTSLSDAGLAASTAEAMACGLPVVITDFGDNRRWVKDGEGGYLVPLKSPMILAQKIVYLLKNEDARRQFGQVNRSVIKERNNYYIEMAKVEHIYQELIGEYSV